MTNEKTQGVNTLLGDPKNAILKLSVPMIIAMLINSLYMFIDGIWLAGLGENALAAVGFVTPMYLIVMGFSNGLGAGATAIISRYIGAKDKKEADNAALHVMLLTGIFTIIFTIGALTLLRPYLGFMGAGSAMNLSLDYGTITFLGSIFIVFSAAAYGVLRAEGNVKKATHAMVLGAILNIILDPILIYTLGLGVKGAAIATIISLGTVSLLLLYWFRKDTYIKFSPKDFIYKNTLIKQILGIGLPAGSEMLINAILVMSLNLILIVVSGLDGVAVYNGGWRMVMVALVPAIAIGMSVVAVTGASFGAEKFENIKIAHIHGIKIGFAIVGAISLFTFIFAPYISYFFTYSPESIGLRSEFTEFFRATCLFYLFVPLGICSSSVFQGLGKGLNSLLLTIIRTLVLVSVFAYILAIPLGLGQTGVWYGLVLGNACGSIIAFIWARKYIKKLIVSKNT